MQIYAKRIQGFHAVISTYKEILETHLTLDLLAALPLLFMRDLLRDLLPSHESTLVD